MSPIPGTSEQLLRTILEGMSDRIAGRPFRNADPAFFGTPDEPSLAISDPEQDTDLGTQSTAPGSIDGSDVSGGASEGGHDHGANFNRTGSLAWGGHANGRIPREEMTEIGGGHLLESQAAKDWNRMVEAAARDGIDISITDSYRSYQGQVDVRRRKGHLVATAKPGTSNHGWGRAVDANVNDPKTLQWLRENASRFGWVNPEWAKRAGKSYEPWHWEYRKVPSQQVPSEAEAHAHEAPRTVQALDFSLPRSSPEAAEFESEKRSEIAPGGPF